MHRHAAGAASSSYCANHHLRPYLRLHEPFWTACRTQFTIGQPRGFAAAAAQPSGTASGSALAETLITTMLEVEEQPSGPASDQRRPEAMLHLHRMLSMRPDAWQARDDETDKVSGEGPTYSTSGGRPLARRTFCTNCCAPTAGKACSHCNHDRANDAQLLGSSDVWKQFPSACTTSGGGNGGGGGGGAAPATTSSDGQQRQAVATTAAAVAPGRVALGFDERMLLHRAGLWPHPERPECVQAVMSHLHSSGLVERCNVLECREATDAELEAVHSRELIEALAATRALGQHAGGCGETLRSGEQIAVDDLAALSAVAAALPHVAADTLYNGDTYRAARLAAGTAAEAAQAVASGRASAALAIVRPPGHQASRDMAQGGCFFNSAAVAVRAAQAAGKERILLFDWGVHHGAGTQSIFEGDTSVLYVSMHRHGDEFYPNTGDVFNVGGGVASDDMFRVRAGAQQASTPEDGAGYSMNIPWNEHRANDSDFLSAMCHVVMPAAYDFGPDMVIISAGFDSALNDFTGDCRVTSAGYAAMTHTLRGLAPVVMVLEGGSNLSATSRGVAACLRVLLGEQPQRLPAGGRGTSTGWAGIMNAMQVHGTFWGGVRPLSYNGWSDVVRSQQQQGGEGGDDEGDPRSAAMEGGDGEEAEGEEEDGEQYYEQEDALEDEAVSAPAGSAEEFLDEVFGEHRPIDTDKKQ